METVKKSVNGIVGVILAFAAAFAVFEGGMWLVRYLGDNCLPWTIFEIIPLSILTLAVIFGTVIAFYAVLKLIYKP